MALGSTQPLVPGTFPGSKGGRCVRLTTLPRSCAACHELLESKPPGTLWPTPALLRDSFTFTYTSGLNQLVNDVLGKERCYSNAVGSTLDF